MDIIKETFVYLAVVLGHAIPVLTSLVTTSIMKSLCKIFWLLNWILKGADSNGSSICKDKTQVGEVGGRRGERPSRRRRGKRQNIHKTMSWGAPNIFLEIFITGCVKRYSQAFFKFLLQVKSRGSNNNEFENWFSFQRASLWLMWRWTRCGCIALWAQLTSCLWVLRFIHSMLANINWTTLALAFPVELQTNSHSD